jgi:hypothetical protein
VSVSVPKTIEKTANIEEHFAVVRSSNATVHEPLLHDEYKQFLTRYSLPFKHDEFDEMPVSIFQSKSLNSNDTFLFNRFNVC